MSSRRSSHKKHLKMQELAASFSEEDGMDPKEFHQYQPPSRGGRKTMQLCKQVFRALGYAFSACEDETVSDLFVESVEPAPDATHLMVTVTPMNEGITQESALTSLFHATPFLRSEISADIHRKKTPELSFRFRPRQTSETSTVETDD